MIEKISSSDSTLLNLDLPKGWIYLNKKFIDENFAERIGQELSKNKILENFFNGRMQTSFDIALTSSVPRRFFVEDLKEKINDYANKNELRVTLLTGPGGEGKSTILQQLAIDLVNQTEPKFHVLYRDFGSKAKLHKKELEKLLVYKDESGEKHNFIIVSDNAHEIAKDVFHRIESEIGSKHKIQFLLASRGTHWRWQKAHRYPWKRLVNDDYEIQIAKLTEEDAEKIIIAWDKAEGQNNANVKTRIAKLFNAAKDEKILNRDSNSFYRAIFQLRKNQTLESYIEDILNEFANVKIPVRTLTLKDFYAYVLILHADGFPILTRPILCQALGCEENQLRETIELLDDEKGELLVQSKKYILTRHDVFAEETKRILLEQNDPTYFDKILSELVVAAYQYYKDYGTNRDDIQEWHRLPGAYFYDLDNDNENKSTRRRQAIAMAEALGKRFYSEPVLITQWAKFLHLEGKVEEAKKVIKEYYPKLTPDKGYFVEWAVIMGLLDKSFISAWLSGIVLDDEVKEEERGKEPPILHLCNLGTALSKSFQKVSDIDKTNFYNLHYANIFKSATEGIIRLISDERAKVDAKPGFNFDKSEKDKADIHKRIGNEAIPKLTLEKSFELIEAGIELAYQIRNLDNEELPESLPRPPLNLNKIKVIFGIGVENNRSHTFQTIILGSLAKPQLVPQITEKPLETNETPKFALRKKIDSRWEIILNGQKFLVKNTFGVRAIHKLLKKNKENNEPITVILATELYQGEDKTTGDLKQVGKRLNDAIDLVFANIEPRTREYDLLRVFIKVSQSTKDPHLEYNPSNYKQLNNIPINWVLD